MNKKHLEETRKEQVGEGGAKTDRSQTGKTLRSSETTGGEMKTITRKTDTGHLSSNTLDSVIE